MERLIALGIARPTAFMVAASSAPKSTRSCVAESVDLYSSEEGEEEEEEGELNETEGDMTGSSTANESEDNGYTEQDVRGSPSVVLGDQPSIFLTDAIDIITSNQEDNEE